MTNIGLGNLRKPAARRQGLVLRGAIGLAAALALGLTSGSALAQGSKRIAGLASYYSKNYHGRVASGGHYDPRKYTAAHRRLPFGTRLRVTNPHTKRSVTVVVNDRGPFIRGRVLDLSFAAAQALHMTGPGVIRVVAVVQ
jgi:rare lipoprotein A